MALGKLMQEDPTFSVHTDQDTGQTMISRHGRAAPRDHRRPPDARVQRRRQRRQAAGRLQARRSRSEAEGEGRFIRQTGGRGQYGHAKIRMRPDEPRRDFVFDNEIIGGVDPQGVHQADRAGHQGGAGDRPARRLPADRRRGRPLRRQLPRRRLLRDGVQDRRLDGVPGRRQEGAPGAARADHGGRGRDPRRLHGRRHRRPHLAPRPHPEHGAARRRPGDHRHGAAVGDVRLRDRPALADARAAPTTRCSSRPTSRRPRTSAKRSSPRRRAERSRIDRGAEERSWRKEKFERIEAARERRDDRSRGPRQDDVDGGDHEGAGVEGAGELRGVRPDRQGAGGARARHHDRDGARGVPERRTATTRTWTARATPTT